MARKALSSSERDVMPTRAPERAKARAAARPMPCEAPVISTRLSFKSLNICVSRKKTELTPISGSTRRDLVEQHLHGLVGIGLIGHEGLDAATLETLEEIRTHPGGDQHMHVVERMVVAQLRRVQGLLH